MHRKAVIFAFFGGAILGSIIGFGISIMIAFPFFLVLDHQSDVAPAVFAVALCTMIPTCGIALGHYLAKREYREQLESVRLHSHFCKRCGYDLRGSVDIVCPECGTGISAQQRRHIKELLDKS